MNTLVEILVTAALIDNPLDRNGKPMRTDRSIVEEITINDAPLRSLIPSLGEPDAERIGQEALIKKGRTVAIGIAERVRKAFPGDRPTRFFTASFEPSPEQVNRIEHTMYDPTVIRLLHDHPFLGSVKTFGELAREVTLNPDFEVPVVWMLSSDKFEEVLRNGPSYLASLDLHTQQSGSLSLDELRMLLASWKETAPDVANTEMGKLLQFMVDLAPYRTYDVQDAVLPEKMLAEIPAQFRRMVAVAGTRPDVIGSYATTKDDKEAWGVIDAYIKLTKGGHFGHAPFLDTASLSKKDREAVTRYFTFMRDGRIHASVVEIKTLLFHERVVGDEVVKSSLTSGMLRRFERSTAYTIWGWTQQMIASLRESDLPEAKAFLDAISRLTTLPLGEANQLEELRVIAPALRAYIDPLLKSAEGSRLIVVRWPILRQELVDKRPLTVSAITGKHEGKTGEPMSVRFSIPNAVVEHNDPLATDEGKQVNANRLYRLVRQAGRTLLRKVAKVAAFEAHLGTTLQEGTVDPRFPLPDRAVYVGSSK